MTPHPRDRDIRALALFLLAFLATLTIVGACTPNKRIKTLQVALVSVNAIRDGFLAWDRQHQHDLVESATSRADGLAKLAAYQAKRDLVLRRRADGLRTPEVFELVYLAISIAATQTDELSLTDALAKADELARAMAILMGGGE